MTNPACGHIHILGEKYTRQWKPLADNHQLFCYTALDIYSCKSWHVLVLDREVLDIMCLKSNIQQGHSHGSLELFSWIRSFWHLKLVTNHPSLVWILSALPAHTSARFCFLQVSFGKNVYIQWSASILLMNLALDEFVSNVGVMITYHDSLPVPHIRPHKLAHTWHPSKSPHL